MPDLLCVGPLDRPARRPVGLQRHLEDDRGADPGDLGEQGGGVGACSRTCERTPSSKEPSSSGREAPSNIAADSTAVRDAAIATAASLISMPTSRPPKPRAWNSSIRAPSPQPTSERAGRFDPGTPAQLDHVLRLADGAERAPARIEVRLCATGRVGLFVELDQAAGVLHLEDYCGRDDGQAHGVVAQRAGDGAGHRRHCPADRLGDRPGRAIR